MVNAALMQGWACGACYGTERMRGALRRYFNDLWEYDIEELRWRGVSPGSAARPSPRGGSQVAVAGRFRACERVQGCLARRVAGLRSAAQPARRRAGGCGR